RWRTGSAPRGRESGPSGRRGGHGRGRPRRAPRARRRSARAESVGCEPSSRGLPGARAELDVVDVVRDRRMLAADRAVWIAAKLDFAELTRERVEHEEPSDQGVADLE